MGSPDQADIRHSYQWRDLHLSKNRPSSCITPPGHYEAAPSFKGKAIFIVGADSGWSAFFTSRPRMFHSPRAAQILLQVESCNSVSELQLVMLQKQLWLITWATKKDSAVSWSRSSLRTMLDWNSSSLGGFIADQFIRQNWWSQQTRNTVTSDWKPNKATTFCSLCVFLLQDHLRFYGLKSTHHISLIPSDEVQIHSARKLQLPARCFDNSKKPTDTNCNIGWHLMTFSPKTPSIRSCLSCLPWRGKAAHHFLKGQIHASF